MEGIGFMGRWTVEELEYLIDNYSTKDKNEIIMNLSKHKWQNIQAKASQLKIKRNVKHIPSNKLSQEDAFNVFYNNGFTPLEDYIDSDTPIKCIDNEGYCANVRHGDIKQGQGVALFDKKNPYTTINIKNWLKLNNKSFELCEDEEYTDADKTKLKFKCNICKGIFEAYWYAIKQGNGCGVCKGFQIDVDVNSIYSTNNDLVDWFVNKDDCKILTINSNKTTLLKCIHCGHIKPMIVSNFTKQGFGCPICSDGISTPNKFLIELLCKSNIDFMPEKTFNWSDKKRYDFYIPSLNIIIEMHGIQHYDRPHMSRTLEEEIENDIIKKRLAYENGVSDYIVVDCRQINKNWIVRHLIQSLSTYFDFSDVDFDEVWSCCQHSNVIDATKMFNNGSSIREISAHLKLHEQTIRRYLKRNINIEKINAINEKKEEIS